MSIRPATLKYNNFDDHIFQYIRTFSNGEPKYLYTIVLVELDSVLRKREFDRLDIELSDAWELYESDGINIPIELYKRAYISRDRYFNKDSNKLKNSMIFNLNKLNMYMNLSREQQNIMSDAIENCDLDMFYSQYNIECYDIAGW